MQRWYPIATKRLLLRGFAAGDLSDIQDYASDPEVVRFTAWGPNTIDVTRDVLARWLRDQEKWPRDSVTLAIELTSERRLIGAIRMDVKDSANRCADFGYAVNRCYWGRGYATEAAGAIISAAFRRLGLHRVWATCDIRNHASYRVMEKLNMRREGMFRKDVMQRGEWRDSFLYAVLAEEWPAASDAR